MAEIWSATFLRGKIIRVVFSSLESIKEYPCTVGKSISHECCSSERQRQRQFFFSRAHEGELFYIWQNGLQLWNRPCFEDRLANYLGLFCGPGLVDNILLSEREHQWMAWTSFWSCCWRLRRNRQVWLSLLNSKGVHWQCFAITRYKREATKSSNSLPSKLVEILNNPPLVLRLFGSLHLAVFRSLAFTSFLILLNLARFLFISLFLALFCSFDMRPSFFRGKKLLRWLFARRWVFWSSKTRLTTWLIVSCGALFCLRFSRNTFLAGKTKLRFWKLKKKKTKKTNAPSTHTHTHTHTHKKETRLHNLFPFSLWHHLNFDRCTELQNAWWRGKNLTDGMRIISQKFTHCSRVISAGSVFLDFFLFSVRDLLQFLLGCLFDYALKSFEFLLRSSTFVTLVSLQFWLIGFHTEKHEKQTLEKE